jgi:hypothetical protein
MLDVLGEASEDEESDSPEEDGKATDMKRFEIQDLTKASKY